MESTWVVDEVTEKPGIVTAKLRQVEWFKKNPAFEAAMADESEEELPEEFIDAAPGELGAESIEVGGSMTLDITDGPELHAMDNLLISVRVLVPVDA